MNVEKHIATADVLKLHKRGSIWTRLSVWSHSLVGRIVLIEFAIIFALAIVLPIVTTMAISRIADRTISEQLIADANAVAATLSFSQDRWRISADPYATSSLAMPDESGGFVIVERSGRVLWTSPRGATFLRALPGADFSPGFHKAGKWSVAVRRVRQGGHAVDVIVYHSRVLPGSIIDRVSHKASRQLSFLMTGVLALSLLAQIVILRLNLKGLDRAARQADGIGLEDLTLRIDGTALPVEIRKVVDAANSALDRVDAAYRDQRAFAGSVAHELRTPIAHLRLMVERLPDEDPKPALLQAIDRQARVVEQLMALSALEGLVPEIEAVDLCNSARETLSELALEAFRADKRLTLNVPDFPIMVSANAALLYVILRNLISNAVRHTPPGTDIVVSVNDDGSVDVIDDGPGITRLGGRLEGGEPRYVRGDHARSDGAGLGLKIVQGTVNRLRGHLRISTGEPGGRVHFAFPLAWPSREETI